jgi:hypothetical protein
MQIQLGSKLAIASLAFIGAALLTPAHAATNRAPVISGAPVRTATAGKLYSFQPSARDADGNELWFWVTSKPAWAQLDRTTGRLYGTPTSAQVGVYEQIQIVAWDGKAAAKLAKFAINVVANPKVGRAPTISGAPVTTATIDKVYAFNPKAFDMDGDVLTFTVTGRPAWATLNPRTGQLTGKPTQVGVHPNVEITVSDGVTRSSLPKFAITVNAASVVTKSVALSWTAPTQNIDGSALTNLSGYRIVHGSAPGSYSQSITLNTVGLSSYVIENLKAGKHYFAVMARNSNGVESPLSAEIDVNLL